MIGSVWCLILAGSSCPGEPSSPGFSPSSSPRSPTNPPTDREELLTPVTKHYVKHTCCKVTLTHTRAHTHAYTHTRAQWRPVTPDSSPQACVPSSPSMKPSSPAFWGQNPLKVPLLCGFKRLRVVDGCWSMTSPLICKEAEPEEEEKRWEVFYQAPCGLSLLNHDDVMSYLLATETYDLLQVSHT